MKSSSQTEAVSAGDAPLLTAATSNLGTLLFPDGMMFSTPITEMSEMVVKKTTEETDPWSNEPEKQEVPVNPDLLTVTLKAGTGFDAPWLVAHASGVTHAIEILEHDEWPKLVDLATSRGKEFVRQNGGQSAPRSPANGPGGPSWSNDTNQGSGGSQIAATAVRNGSCPHGQAVYKSGEKNGRPWSGSFCPNTDRNNQCTPEFKR